MPPLRELIYRGHDPYAGFDAAQFPGPLQGWAYDHPIFENLISALTAEPAVIVEVGTLYGASAIHMAALCKRLGKCCEIVCVDTFLGSFQDWSGKANDLNLRFGRPEYYWRFLANVVRAGHQDIITPCPMPSVMAAKLLTFHKARAALVYLDAGHEYEDVATEIRAFWPLVRPDGVLFGDDFDPFWPGVVKAVEEWARAERLELMKIIGMATSPSGRMRSVKWGLRKPR
jgi:hypothetical protein